MQFLRNRNVKKYMVSNFWKIVQLKMVNKKLEQGKGKDKEQVTKDLFISWIVLCSSWTMGHCAHAEKVLLRTQLIK